MCDTTMIHLLCDVLSYAKSEGVQKDDVRQKNENKNN